MSRRGSGTALVALVALLGSALGSARAAEDSSTVERVRDGLYRASQARVWTKDGHVDVAEFVVTRAGLAFGLVRNADVSRPVTVPGVFAWHEILLIEARGGGRSRTGAAITWGLVGGAIGSVPPLFYGAQPWGIPILAGAGALFGLVYQTPVPLPFRRWRTVYRAERVGSPR